MSHTFYFSRLLAVCFIAAAQSQDIVRIFPSEQVTAQIGKNFKLRCEAVKRNSSPLRWSLNKVMIFQELEKRIIVSEDRDEGNGRFLHNSHLEVINMSPSDVGTYFCAKNEKDLGNQLGFATVVVALSVDPVDATLVVGEDATLRCSIGENVTNFEALRWYREEDPTKPLGSDDRHLIEVGTSNGSLTIKKAVITDIGNYTCAFERENQTFTAVASLNGVPHVKDFESSSRNIVQEDSLTLNCKVRSQPRATVTWYRDEKPLDYSDPRITLSTFEDYENATLKIKDLQFEDRATYMCSAVNVYGVGNSTILIRVKDKLAALWPFLGICCEVIILCTIIFIYEKHRAKKMEEEEETPDEAGHLTNSHDHKGKDEIRQRK